MRKLIFLCLGLSVFVAACGKDQSAEIGNLKTEIAALKAERSRLEILAGEPPISLDNLYPPEAAAPVYLFKMFDMATSMTGVAVNLFQNDLQNADSAFNNFKSQYTELSKLVPEWKDLYPMEPVEEFGEAVKSRDHEKVMTALGEIDKVCFNCHMVNTQKVQQRYHWQDFYEISTMDSVTNEDVDYKQFMQRLWWSFGAIGIDLRENQLENSLKHFEEFGKRFGDLKETCVVCHETERKYYVDKGVQDLIDRLGEALRSGSPDPKVVEELSQGIGIESCLKCHWVHSPAALTKIRWITQ